MWTDEVVVGAVPYRGFAINSLDYSPVSVYNVVICPALPVNFEGVGFFVVDPASLFLYLFFLMCSAYFACTETAYTAVSKVRLRTLADKGNKRAQKALWICERFDKTLTTILVGNNVFHAACASLSALLVLRQFGESFVAAGTVVTTVIVYLFAEMLPKSLARARSEEISLDSVESTINSPVSL